jgi:hypothetical protein
MTKTRSSCPYVSTNQRRHHIPTFRQIFLPYTLVNLGDRWFLPVNRSYKPIGCPAGWYDYLAHQSKIRIKSLTPARAESIGLRAAGDNDPVEGVYLYLYNDATNPENSAANWRRYEAIMARLMKSDVQHFEKRQSHHYPADAVATF